MVDPHLWYYVEQSNEFVSGEELLTVSEWLAQQLSQKDDDNDDNG